MNRGLLVTLAVLNILASGVGKFVRDTFYSPSIRGSTPSGGGRGGGHHRFRPHAPNDGKWHMKYHRGRH